MLLDAWCQDPHLEQFVPMVESQSIKRRLLSFYRASCFKYISNDTIRQGLRTRGAEGWATKPDWDDKLPGRESTMNQSRDLSESETHLKDSSPSNVTMNLWH